jgi:O-antigen/teichoic acid export membrane protein
LAEQWSSILLYEIVVAVAFIAFGAIKRDLILVCVGFTMVPNVLFTFYSYIFQSVGDFSKYTLIVNIYSTINMLINLALVWMRIRDYRIYMVLYVCMECVPFLVGTVLFNKLNWIHFTGFKKDVFTQYVKLGILLMIGNFAYSIFLGIDKWFIKFAMPIEDFSMYSFASQMLTVVNMFITPISMTLYSNMARRQDHNFEIKIKKVLVCFLMIIPVAIYALKFIISTFMKQYIPAINITSALLITQIFLSLNVAVFVNLYKAYKKQKDYFIRLVISLGVAVLTDGIVTAVQPNVMGYALSTMFSCFVWFVLNMGYFKYMIPGVKELLAIAMNADYMQLEKAIFYYSIGAYIRCHNSRRKNRKLAALIALLCWIGYAACSFESANAMLIGASCMIQI